MYKIFNSFLKPQLTKLKTDFQLFEVLNKSIPVLMGIFIFFNPFPHTTSIKEICFYLSVVIVLFVLFFKKNKFSLKTPLFLPFGLLLFWAMVGIFFALNIEHTVHDVYSHLLRYIALYCILINFFQSRKRLIALSWIFIISSTVFSIGGLFYSYVKFSWDLSARMIYLNQRPFNVIGVIAGFAFFLTLNHIRIESHVYRRVFLVMCLFPLFAISVTTYERSIFIGMVLAGIVFLSNHKTKMLIFLGVMVLVFALTPIRHRFKPRNFFHNIRIGANYITLRIIKDYPITGIGFGIQPYENMAREINENKTPKKYKQRKVIGHPHNIVLDITVRLGVVGLVIFFYIIFVFFKMCRECIKKGQDDFIKSWGHCMAAAFVIFFVIGFFQPIFSHAPEVILCSIFAIVTILWRLNNDMINDGKRLS